MRLGIDLDGVVADFGGGWIRRYNLDFGTGIDPGTPHAWGGATELTHFQTMHEFWEWIRDSQEGTIFRSLEPYEGALDALHRLAKRHQIVIVTTKPRWAVHDTFAWIAEHRIPTREVHMTREKWLVDVDVYLDDAPHVLSELVTRRRDALVCRYVRSWNEPIEGAIDIATWQDFELVIDRFEKMR